jgi:hypothetical protein
MCYRLSDATPIPLQARVFETQHCAGDFGRRVSVNLTWEAPSRMAVPLSTRFLLPITTWCITSLSAPAIIICALTFTGSPSVLASVEMIVIGDTLEYPVTAPCGMFEASLRPERPETGGSTQVVELCARCLRPGPIAKRSQLGKFGRSGMLRVGVKRNCDLRLSVPL